MSPLRHPSLEAIDYQALVRAAGQGNRQALEHLLVGAQAAAYRFSLLVCGNTDDAEDAMQEALIRTFRHVGRIRRPEAFRTWLYRTVKNACLLGRRRRVDEPKHFVPLDDLVASDDRTVRRAELASPGLQPDVLALHGAVRRRLRAALSRLPESYRLIIYLRDIEGLSTREVARVLDISEANAKTRLHRARLTLRDQLGGLE